MTAIVSRRETFDFGGVFARAFGAVSRNGGAFLLLAVPLGGVPQLLLGFARRALLQDAAALAAAANPTAPASITDVLGALGLVLAVLVLAVASLLLSAVLQAALIYGALEDQDGQRRSAAEMLREGRRAGPALLAIAFMFSLGFGIGFILLIFPALIVATRWIAAAPARVAEGPGISKAFSRSAALTKGYRWPVFGVILVFSVTAWVLAAVMLGSAAAIAPQSLDPDAATASLPFLLVNPVLNVLVSILAAVVVAAIYGELRRMKGGVETALV
jgi:hypothetical protein